MLSREQVAHCWEKTGLLQAWDHDTQVRAIANNVYSELFEKKFVAPPVDDEEEEADGEGFMDDEVVCVGKVLSDDATWELVKDFINDNSYRWDLIIIKKRKIGQIYR